MSYNELYEHKKSDTVKWVLTLIAFIVVGVLIAGLIAGWFDKNEEVPVEQTEQTAAVDGGSARQFFQDGDLHGGLPAEACRE